MHPEMHPEIKKVMRHMWSHDKAKLLAQLPENPQLTKALIEVLEAQARMTALVHAIPRHERGKVTGIVTAANHGAVSLV